MANLYAVLNTDRGHLHRFSSHSINCRLETWQGAILVDLDREGNASVYIGEKTTPNTRVWTGNINKRGDTP